MNIFYFFGDSITLGVNVLPKDSFVHAVIESLAEKCGVPPSKFYNLGACKNSSKEISQRFLPEFSARNLPGSTPFFFLMCGVVDTMKFTDTPYLSPEQSEEYFRGILEKAKEHGKTVAVSPTPVANGEQNKRLAELAAAQEKICRELSVPYLNIFDSLLCKEFTDDLKDGVHPSEKGNRLIAEAILQKLYNCLSL